MELTIDPANPLTPSDLVLLYGEEFAQKAMLGNTALLHSGAKVSTARLGEALLAAALLAGERTGALRLEVRKKKALLGLRRVDSLFARPDESGTPWPASCLEAALAALAGRPGTDGEPPEVRALLYTWLAEDRVNPWQEVVSRTMAGLAQRGLLEATEERKLKIFSVTRYELPESTARLRERFSPEPVRQMLADCEQFRPEVWKLLVQQIRAAIRDRTEQSDSDFD